jgi:hypothetical protein
MAAPPSLGAERSAILRLAMSPIGLDWRSVSYKGARLPVGSPAGFRPRQWLPAGA